MKGSRIIPVTALFSQNPAGIPIVFLKKIRYLAIAKQGCWELSGPRVPGDRYGPPGQRTPDTRCRYRRDLTAKNQYIRFMGN
jgi:hypothetical protein